MVLCIWLTTLVLWFPASALMWSGQCGFRGQTRSNSRLLRDLFPPPSQQDVFNEPQCVWTVASRHGAVQAPQRLACATWKGRGSEIRNMQKKKDVSGRGKRCLRDKDHKSNVGRSGGEISVLWRFQVTGAALFLFCPGECFFFFRFPAANVPMSGSMQPHSRIPPNVL